MCLGLFVSFMGAYAVPRDYNSLIIWLALIGLFSGVFGLFTMYLPPLFPTLLRTTGAGFCYNIGRIAAAFGTVFFGLFSQVGDFRVALFSVGFLIPVAMVFAWILPELKIDKVEWTALAAVMGIHPECFEWPAGCIDWELQYPGLAAWPIRRAQ